MEATHFMILWKNCFGVRVTPILSNTKQYKTRKKLLSTLVATEIVAVWRIKPTDVPLQTRLAERFGWQQSAFLPHEVIYSSNNFSKTAIA